jgi:hypothetical protein
MMRVMVVTTGMRAVQTLRQAGELLCRQVCVIVACCWKGE